VTTTARQNLDMWAIGWRSKLLTGTNTEEEEEREEEEDEEGGGGRGGEE
jgi:hypothetical protein